MFILFLRQSNMKYIFDLKSAFQKELKLLVILNFDIVV